MDVSHSVLFNVISCDSQKQNLNLIVDKLWPVSNMASSRSEENVSLKHFQHLEVSQCWCVLQFSFGHFVLSVWQMSMCV